MPALKPLNLIALLAMGALASGCTSAGKRKASITSLLEMPVATPLSEEESFAALKAIADSANASLPASSAETEGTVPGESESGEADPSQPETGQLAQTPPESWQSRGLNPREVNPGDLFLERQGPFLHKVASLLDELPPSERNPLLNQFTTSKTARVPLTLSRTELAELRKESPPETALPSRSVALDFRMESHAVDPDRFRSLLSRIGAGESAGAIASPDRLKRLRKQLDEAKQHLESGGSLYVITSVGESSVVHATYPGAPVGKRDAEPIRNAVELLYPHAGELAAEKTSDSIELSGNPRIVWEFETREVRLEGGAFVIGPEPFELR